MTATIEPVTSEMAQALEAIRFAEATMSEDVLNAVTGDYAADHNIYDAIGMLQAVIAKADERQEEEQEKENDNE